MIEWAAVKLIREKIDLHDSWKNANFSAEGSFCIYDPNGDEWVVHISIAKQKMRFSVQPPNVLKYVNLEVEYKEFNLSDRTFGEFC